LATGIIAITSKNATVGVTAIINPMATRVPYGQYLAQVSKRGFSCACRRQIYVTTADYRPF
jgi:hypothetical protein